MAMIEMLKKLAVEDEGADATEYALLAALVAVAMIGAATLLGSKINGVFNHVQNTLSSAAQ